MTTNTDTAIHSHALLVWLTISTWSARRYDKTVTAKVNAQYAASDDAGRYNKHLLPGDAPAYKALITLAGSIRAAHYSHTLAWSDEGWRLLPTANYMPYVQWFRDQQRALDIALDAFIIEYPTLRQQARVRLNGLYRDEDYPTCDDLRSRFRLALEYAPVPADGDIRVDLASDQIATIESSVQSRVESATRLAMADAWKRLYDVVARMVERLSTPNAIFRDSLVTNAADVCEQLQRLNITNDPDLEAMRLRVQSELTKYDPDTLRDTPRVRRQAAASAEDIMVAMSGLYTVQS